MIEKQRNRVVWVLSGFIIMISYSEQNLVLCLQSKMELQANAKMLSVKWHRRLMEELVSHCRTESEGRRRNTQAMMLARCRR